MDIPRIRAKWAGRHEIRFVEAHPTSEGGVFVKSAMQTSAGNTYFMSIYFPDYPNQMPKVCITKPALRQHKPTCYKDGNICFLHPNMWNPGATPDIRARAHREVAQQIRLLVHKRRPLARRRGAPLNATGFCVAVDDRASDSSRRNTGSRGRQRRGIHHRAQRSA